MGGIISDYLYKKASLLKIPLFGCFELSPICNFSCSMCYVRKNSEQIQIEGKRIKTCEEWLSLAEECKAAGTLYLLLTGGEPFIYPEFRKLYSKLHQMGFLISINTNGTMIDAQTIEWLKDMAPIRVNVTLYGSSEDTYEKICGNRDGYKKAKEAILLLKKAGIQVVINASMIPENANDMENIIAFGKKYDIFTRISTYMFPPVRRACEESDSRFTPEESAKMFLEKHRLMMGRESFNKFLNEHYQKVCIAKVTSEDNWGTNMEYMRCRAGRSSFWVSWDGTMTACGMLPFPIEVFPFDNLFQECWIKLTNTVRSTKVLSECNKCEKKDVCNPCVAMLYSETGNVNSNSKYLCDLAEHVVSGIKRELEKV